MNAHWKRLAPTALICLSMTGPTGCWNASVTNLGPLGGSLGFDINELGHVAGTTFDADSRRRPFVFDGEVLTDLGPVDAVSSTAFGLNDEGQVVGHLRHEPNSQRVAFLYDPSTGMQELGTLGGDSSIAWAVNNAGQIVGWSDLADDDEEDDEECMFDSLTCGTSHAFLWEDGSMTDLGTLGGSTSQARAINATGQIVGWAETAGGRMRAVLWENGTIIDLGVGGMAYDINDAGDIVGTLAGNVTPFLYRDGEVTELGIVGWPWTGGYGINNHGQVVGTYVPVDAESPRPPAFLWEDGELVDLESLTWPLSGWRFYEALDINDNGQIIARGYRTLNRGGGAVILTLPRRERFP